MGANLYHHLAFLPATEHWEMPPRLEALAVALLKSGKLRINADHERNFVRYHEQTFSARELTDPALAATTRARLARHVAPAAGVQGVEDALLHLARELKKARGVAPAKESKVARVLVQATAPEVMALLLSTGAEIYVSYAHNVADLMAVHEWQTHGENSGLQATDSAGAAVYVSAGGDPFFEGEQKTYTTDGFPALARMVVIAGQELGHFADLRRNARGGVVGRHSTDIHASQLRADPVAREARLADRTRVENLFIYYNKMGLSFLRRAEKGVAFYSKRRRFSLAWAGHQLWRILALLWFTTRCFMQRGHNIYCVPSGLLPKGTQYILCPLCMLPTLPRMMRGEAIEAYLLDMKYNLAPDAEVYRHPDPLVEEAIAVIEAVARVPQQTHKWGKRAVYAAWPGLAAFYDTVVLPACRAQIGTAPAHTTHGVMRRVRIAIRRAVRPRPGYYP